MSSRSGKGKRKLKGGSGGTGFEEWGGYMQAKIQKLQDQFQEEAPEECARTGQVSNIFAPIAIFVNGYTRPPAAELKTLMKQHGGTYHQYYQRSVVTHIIASNLANSKVQNLTDKKVVRPDWVMDSIKSGKLLSHEPYLLYTARSKAQPGISKFAASSSASTSASSLHDDPTMSSVKSVNQTEPSITDDSSKYGAGYKDQLEKLIKNNPNNSTIQAEAQIKESTDKPLPQNNKDGGYRSIGDARDPKFISEYYNNSRLHHIATWGAEYKALVTKLQKEGDTSFPGRDELRLIVDDRNISDYSGKSAQQPSRVIMHIDMDCFFVSVGLRKRPDLLGKPVAVTHSRGKATKAVPPGTDLSYEAAHYSKQGLKLRKGPGRGMVDPNLEHEGFMDGDDKAGTVTGKVNKPAAGVGDRSTAEEMAYSMAEIASCNYEARQAGVKNGMLMGRARTLCPALQTIPYDFDGYQEVSQILYSVIASFTHDIEAVSCDEMLVDSTDLLADTRATPEEFATLVRRIIHEKTACNASAGLGPNILLARLATHKAKPNGQFLLKEGAAKDFIKDVSVSDLPGVGRAMMNKLSALGITTCADLQRFPLAVLQSQVGAKTGQTLYRFCRGEDSRSIKSEQVRKSVSAEVNYGIRFTCEADVRRFIHELCGEINTRLAKVNVKGKTITLKLKVRAEDAPKESAKFMGHGVCDNITKSVTIPMATDNPDIITKEVMGIIHNLRIAPTEYRGVGIQISRLEAPVQQKSARRGNQTILSFTTKQSSHTGKQSTTLPAQSSNSEVHIAGAQQSLISNVTPGSSTTAVCMPVSDIKDCTESSELNACLGIAVKPIVACKTAVDDILDLPLIEEDVVISPELLTASPPLTDENSGDSNATPMESDTEQTGTSHRVNIILPPLPTMPEFCSPPSRSAAQTTTPSVESILLPSPSQMDMNVLMELPEDIREQIQGEMAAQSRKTRRNTITERSQPVAASASRLTTPAVARATVKQEEPIVALPSPSQLDPSCLEALPAELRAELEEAYKKESGHAPTLRSKSAAASATPALIHPLMLVKKKQPIEKHPSPKKQSPGRAKRGSPQFKRPRGRGRGRGSSASSRKELTFGKIETRTNKEDTNKTVPAVVLSPEASTSAEPEASTSHGDSTVSTSTAAVNPAMEAVNLCGAVTLAEVKDLLKKWSMSCDVPETTDIGHLTQYLYNLVDDHNLEQLHLVLKYFRRCVSQREWSAEWDEAYEEVLGHAQTIILSTYGCQLKM